ncbi:Signal transduction histidine kinase [Tistlia consotensis]|uniref:histidine kinase n=1 Tax=Tistlia consotensis USBA 355 TaxID=560819 RepID=A0A1Y6B679_9PROT|nr:ATP-binding protein [Tistlia consotensis]SME92914.1 Signal transduction histidine kinase [Tistlia consotensis USBA 355]SNR28345.1 Signal transduction histidine kinase [Tistlia consotensis]
MHNVQSIERLRRLIRRLALLIALVTAVSIPLGYFAIAYRSQSEELAFRADLTAKVLARYVYMQGPAWRYSRERLEELLADEPDRAGEPQQVVRLPDGTEVVRHGPDQTPPLHEAATAVSVRGRPEARVTAQASLRPLLLDTALAALFSSALGGAIWLVIGLLPLRALKRSLAELDRTLETVERHAAETEYAYEELKRQHRLVEETTHELMKARDEAMAADRAKSAFLATMSHELRTPLNAIIGFSEVLTLGVFGPLGNDRYRDYCQAIGDSGRHLLAVINDVLDISKIEAGKLQLHFEEVQLDKLLESCCALVRGKVDGAGILLELAPPETPLPRLWADPVKLKQIVLNLLSNALKFTPAGGTIRVSCAQVEERGIGFSIADSGIGMRPEDVKLALQPFQQVDNSHTRRYEGTGLGLPLAKALVEQHGGELEIESALGRGTTVTVVLPDHDRSGAQQSTGAQGHLDLQLPGWLGKRSA